MDLKNRHTHFENQSYERDSLRDGYFRFKDWLQARNYSERTLLTRKHHLRYFIEWCEERDLRKAVDITRPILDRYVRHLSFYRKADDHPLSLGTQRARIVSVRAFFRWMSRQHLLLYNPASELESPKVPYVLPRSVLTADQMESVIAQTDLKTSKGIRDRAILEVFYSTGIRRMELLSLQLDSVDWNRETVFIREGKGRKDRVVPIGERALLWLRKYTEEIRPYQCRKTGENTLFLSPLGNPIPPRSLSDQMKAYLVAADIHKKGSCQIFRHTTATLMLENGADTRYIQQMLGHSKLETTQIYTRVSITKLKEVHKATHPAKLPEGFSLDNEEEKEKKEDNNS